MRILTVSASIALLTACSGGSEAPPAAPEAPPAPPAEPNAAAPALTVPADAIGLLTWTDDNGACRADLAVVGGVTTRIGTIPGPCPARTWTEAQAIRTSDGRVLLKTPTGALERATDGTIVVLPALPAGWELGDVTYDGAGAIVAAGEYKGGAPEVKEADGARVYAWNLEGEALTYKTEGYEADVVVCGAFAWTDGAWKRTAAKPTGLAEGTSPPFCYAGVENAPSPLAAPSDGGPGVALDAAPDAAGPAGDWHRDGPFALKASEWLEGQTRLGPVYFAGTTPWTPLAGFDGSGVIALDLKDTWAIVCSESKGAVIDLATGKATWEGARCPTAW